MQYIVFGKPLINSKQKKEVLNTLNSGWIGSGPKVQILEEKFKYDQNVFRHLTVKLGARKNSAFHQFRLLSVFILIGFLGNLCGR